MPDVLVVDDRRDSRELVACWLDRAGQPARLAETDAAALEAMATAPVAAVVVSVRAPAEDRIALARCLRTLSPDVALIFVTGDSGIGLVLARAGIAPFDYLAEPFTEQELADTVTRACRRHQAKRLARVHDDIASANRQASVWGFDAATGAWLPRADWVPSPGAVSRLVSDLRLRR
jgi:DNA-binding NtrC family response regulator